MSDEKKVLIDVDIKATAALKELAELRIKADELRKAQKELGHYDRRGTDAVRGTGAADKGYQCGSKRKTEDDTERDKEVERIGG